MVPWSQGNPQRRHAGEGARPVYTLYGYNGTFTKYGMDVQEEALKAGQTPGKPGWGVEPKDIGDM